MARRPGDHKPKAGRPEQAWPAATMLWRTSAGVSDLLDLGALEPVWDELYPAEQARSLRLLIELREFAAS